MWKEWEAFHWPNQISSNKIASPHHRQYFNQTYKNTMSPFASNEVFNMLDHLLPLFQHRASITFKGLFVLRGKIQFNSISHGSKLRMVQHCQSFLPSFLFFEV